MMRTPLTGITMVDSGPSTNESGTDLFNFPLVEPPLPPRDPIPRASFSQTPPAIPPRVPLNPTGALQY